MRRGEESDRVMDTKMKEAEKLRTALTQAVDLIHGFEKIEIGVTGALRLFQAATDADLWFLMRRSEGRVCSIISSIQDLSRVTWSDSDDFLSQARRIGDLSATSILKVLPENLRGLRSMISVPLDMSDGQSMALVLFSRETSAFTRSDLDLLEQAGRLIEKAVRNSGDHHRAFASGITSDTGPMQHAGALACSDMPHIETDGAYERLVKWQRSVLDITNTLLCTSADNTEATINRALAEAGALAASDRTYVFRLRDTDRIDNTHEWTAPGIEPMIAQLQDMPASLMDEWRNDMAAGRAVHIPNVEALPETSSVRDVLMMQSIRSLLAVPMLRDGIFVGFVGFDAVRKYRRFLPPEIQLLQSVANAVNVVLDRAAAEAAAKTALNSLNAERSRLQTTLSAIPDLILELDPEGRFSAHGAGAGLRTAIPPEEFIGRLPEEVLPPALATLAHNVMHRIDSDEEVNGLEYEFEVDGEARWYSLSAAARFEQQQRCGYVFVIRDVTSQFNQRRSLQRLSKIAELTSNLVIITNAEQKIEWINPAFERRTGWRLEEIIGKRPDSFLTTPETDRSEMLRIGAALREGEPVRAELLNQTRDGEEYWISKDIQPLFAAGGRVEGFIAVQTDITAMKLSHERTLHDRAMALDASGDGIAIADRNGYYVYMNRAHRRMFGIGDEEDVQLLNWRDILPAGAASDFMAKHWETFAATGLWRGELDGLHRDGSLVPQEVSLTLRENGLLFIARDVSERRRMERELHDRAVALDASDDGIAITDPSGHYVYMNAAHRRLFGISDDTDIRELHWQETYTDETVQRFMAREWHKLQANGRWRGQLQGLHSDGSSVPQEVSLTLHDGGILCLTRDISEQLQQSAEQARMREELQLAQRRETIAHLASGVAHDLNNLVAVVAGSISLLAQNVADNDEARASVDRIRRATETARDLVSGLGDLGRPQSVRAKHDLRDLVAEGIELLGSRRIRDHELYVSQPDKPCHVWANGTELLQVIVNLALNACDSSCALPNPVRFAIHDGVRLPDRSPDAGMVRREARNSVFTITDSGAGIDPDMRANLFERYYTTKGDKGTGLGLPIVAGILRDNGAALWIDSVTGTGTTVTVAWPSERPDPQFSAAGAPGHSVGRVNLSGRNILVVDDVQDVADVFSEFLEECGANAVAINDPVEAAALLQDNPSTWAALVTDLDMPGLNGSELARIAATCTPPVPVILVTALPHAIGLDGELFSSVLAKPTQPGKLTNTVYIATKGPQ